VKHFDQKKFNPHMDVIIVRFLMKILTPKAKMKIGSGLDQFRHPGWNHWSISLL